MKKLNAFGDVEFEEIEIERYRFERFPQSEEPVQPEVLLQLRESIQTEAMAQSSQTEAMVQSSQAEAMAQSSQTEAMAQSRNWANEWESEKFNYVNSAISEIGEDFLNFVTPDMSMSRLKINYECYRLGREYVNLLNMYELSDEAADAALYGFKNNFNFVDHLANGETAEHARLITDAINTPGFLVNDYFDETGSFLDYDKIRQFLAKC